MGYVFSFFLGALLGLGGYVYLTREKALSPEDFSQKVFLADQIIQSQLYEVGIQKKNVLLHQTSLKKEGGLSWKESSLKVRVLPPLSFSLVEGNLRRSLSALGTPVSIQSSQKPESLYLEVRVLGRVTHQLTFVCSLPSSLGMGLHPKIAIVIDDLGGENKISQELLRWDLPVTFSILPFTRYSKTLVGHVGQVMQESMQAALAWVRSHATDYDIDPEFFQTKDIHIHVPSGAIPKDGPSAGVTMVSSLVSALTRRPSRQRLAMTGEITLSGQVLPVGGIKEKVLAAKRAGVLEVILPADNEPNVNEDLNPEMLEGLTLHYVKTIQEVVEQGLEKDPVPVEPARPAREVVVTPAAVGAPN